MDLSLTCGSGNSEKVSMKSSEYRKVIKPLLERRRRARINSCLDELKALIMESAENENGDASKLEKADILELTVQHLRNLRRVNNHQGGLNSTTTAVPGDDKFRAGFTECAQEVSAFLSTVNGVDHTSRCRLLSHLSQHITRVPPLSLHSQMKSPSIGDTGHPTPPPSPTPNSAAYSAEYLPVTPVESPTTTTTYVNYQGRETAVYVWPMQSGCSPAAVDAYHPYTRPVNAVQSKKHWRPW